MKRRRDSLYVCKDKGCVRVLSRQGTNFFNQKGVRGSNPPDGSLQNNRGHISGDAPCFSWSGGGHAGYPEMPREKGKRYIIEKKGISQAAACEARRCLRGSNPRWFTTKTKTPANPCHYRAWRVFLFDRPSCPKG